MKRFFVDEHGLTLSGLVVIASLAVFAVMGFIFGYVGVSTYVGGNISCAQTGAQLRLPSNYAFLSDTCYLTLPDGSRIDASKYVGLAGSKAIHERPISRLPPAPCVRHSSAACISSITSHLRTPGTARTARVVTMRYAVRRRAS